MPFASPFLAFGNGVEPETAMKLFGRPKLIIPLGPSSIGEISLNIEYPFMGLVCGAHVRIPFTETRR